MKDKLHFNDNVVCYVVMKICNLFLYKVKEVPLEELHKFGNVKEGVIQIFQSFGIECSDKLYLYRMQPGKFVPLLVDETFTGISDTTTIVAVDMHNLGQSYLNKDSFGETCEMIEERHEALSILQSFHKCLTSDKKLSGILAIECRHNKSIQKLLVTSTDENSPSQTFCSLPDLKKKEPPSQCDHLISVSEYFINKTCGVSLGDDGQLLFRFLGF